MRGLQRVDSIPIGPDRDETATDPGAIGLATSKSQTRRIMQATIVRELFLREFAENAREIRRRITRERRSSRARRLIAGELLRHGLASR
ncbi:MAG TPA: hypothetical protein VIW95_15760 [Candidatus Binatus sp.]|uniref:hypothetical protein n=1 Tax=Candidatus Binatus sp. TaxID=2811406 RepID=UPI002F3E37D1